MKTLLFLLSLIPALASANCGNDYGCGFGEKCVGASSSYAYDGQCVKAANTNNSYERPRAVIMSTCQYKTDCGYGESCVKQSGAAWGTCQ